MNHRIIIYGSTIERANEKFDELVKLVQEEDIVELSRSRFTQCLKLRNGSTYQTVASGSSARGYRWDDAYIDRDIKIGEFIDIILPTGKEGSRYEYF